MNPELPFNASQHPHRRFNPLTGRWVLVSPHRSRRPWQGQQDAPDLSARPPHEPDCFLSIGGAGGARMTGGGFGGCVVGLMPSGRAAHVQRAVEAGYRSPDGEPALLFECHASAAAGPMKL